MFLETTPDGVRVFCTDNTCTVMLVEEGAARAKAVADLNILGDPFEWWVARVLVSDADDRGKGFGSMVLQAALKAIMDSMGSVGSVGRVIVAPGGYDNNQERQRRFYEKNGFRLVTDDGLMEWKCSPESH